LSYLWDLLFHPAQKKDVQIESQKNLDKLQVGKEISYDLSRDGYLFLDSLLANGNSLEFNKQLKVNADISNNTTVSSRLSKGKVMNTNWDPYDVDFDERFSAMESISGIYYTGLSYHTQVYCRITLPKRGNTVFVKLPMEYRRNSSTFDVNVSSMPPGGGTGPGMPGVIAWLVGGKIGETQPMEAIYNIFPDPQGFRVTANGDLLEKRTAIITSQGNLKFTGGFDAGGVTVGSEISVGVTVVQTFNSATNYNYSFNAYFNLDELYNPVVTYVAHASSTGIQQN